MKIAEGRSIFSHKIDRTSRAMKLSSLIDEPDYGTPLNDRLFQDSEEIPTERFIVPRTEAKLAFILAKPMKGLICTIFDVYNTADYVIPALELIAALARRSNQIPAGRARGIHSMWITASWMLSPASLLKEGSWPHQQIISSSN